MSESLRRINDNNDYAQSTKGRPPLARRALRRRSEESERGSRTHRGETNLSQKKTVTMHLLMKQPHLHPFVTRTPGFASLSPRPRFRVSADCILRARRGCAASSLAAIALLFDSQSGKCRLIIEANGLSIICPTRRREDARPRRGCRWERFNRANCQTHSPQRQKLQKHGRNRNCVL